MHIDRFADPVYHILAKNATLCWLIFLIFLLTARKKSHIITIEQMLICLVDKIKGEFSWSWKNLWSMPAVSTGITAMTTSRTSPRRSTGTHPPTRKQFWPTAYKYIRDRKCSCMTCLFLWIPENGKRPYRVNLL